MITNFDVIVEISTISLVGLLYDTGRFYTSR